MPCSQEHDPCYESLVEVVEPEQEEDSQLHHQDI